MAQICSDELDVLVRSKERLGSCVCTLHEDRVDYLDLTDHDFGKLISINTDDFHRTKCLHCGS